MTTKVFNIPKQQVVEAYKLVKANAGSAGIDQQSLMDFEENLQDNLYKIWNRLSSGTGPVGEHGLNYRNGVIGQA